MFFERYNFPLCIFYDYQYQMFSVGMPGLGKNTPSPVSDWKARNGINILRISLGIVFLWFGLLKFFPGVSPAEDIAGRTIATLTFGLIKPSLALPLLAVWECTIGLG